MKNERNGKLLVATGRLAILVKGFPQTVWIRFQKAIQYLAKHWVRAVVCAAFFIALIILTNFNTALFLTFTLVLLLMGLDARIPIGLFVICLSASPFLLAFGLSEGAGRFAEWAFYFLFIGLFLQLGRTWVEQLKFDRPASSNDRLAGVPSAGAFRVADNAGPSAQMTMSGRAVAYLRESLVSAIGYMIIATFAANFLNYFFNVASGRLLGPDAYGEFAALLSIFMILTVPTNSLQAMLAKNVAELGQKDQQAAIKELTIKCLQICSLAAIIAAVAFLVLSRPLAGFLHINEMTPIIICGLTVAVTIFTPIFNGILQGLKSFIWLGSILMAYAAGRFISGLLFIKLGWGVSGALLGGLVSGVMVILVSAYLIRWVFFQEQVPKRFRLRDIGRSYLPFIVSTGIFLLLISVDQIVVKRKFSASIAGDYAAAAFLGKIILYFPSSVGIVVFPKMVEIHVRDGDIKGLLRKALLIVLAGSLAISAIFIAFPHLTVTKLYGEEFAGATSILWVICLAMSGYTMVNIFIYYFLATEESRFLVVSLTICAMLGIAAMYLIASSPFQVALAQLIISGLFIVAAFLRIGKMERKRAGNASQKGPAV